MKILGIYSLAIMVWLYILTIFNSEGKERAVTFIILLPVIYFIIMAARGF